MRHHGYEMRFERRAVAHQAQPGLKVGDVAQGAWIFQAEFGGDERSIDRAEAEGDDRSGVAEDGVTQVVGELGHMLVRCD